MQLEKQLHYIEHNKNFLSLFKLFLLVVFIILLGETSFAQSPWTKLASLPEKIDYKIISLNGKIYAVSSCGDIGNTGGYIYEYDPASNMWTKKSRMKVPRITLSFSIAVLNNKIYVISGSSGRTSSGGFINTPQVEIYDPATDSWTIADSLLIGRSYVEACSSSEKIYAVSGFQLSVTNGVTNRYEQRLIEEFSPVTKHWSEAALLPENVTINRAVFLNDTLYAFGFSVPAYEGAYYVYIPKKNVVENFSPKFIMDPRGDFTMTTCNGKIYCFGGYCRGQLSNKAEVYDPGLKEWKYISDMPKANWLQSATELNGKIYLAGGYKGLWMQGTWETDFYEYDPAKDSSLQ